MGIGSVSRVRLNAAEIAMRPRTFIAQTVKEVPSAYLSGVVEQLFDTIRKEVLARPKLSQKERSWFEGEAKTFDDHLKKILRNKNKRQQFIALRAVASALCLSFYHAGGKQILREMKGDFQKEQTAPANAAVSARLIEIKRIVERHATPLRSHRPKLSAGNIALAIFHPVIKEVSKLECVPEKWRVQDPDNLTKDEKKRVVENIRGHIRRSTLDK